MNIDDLSKSQLLLLMILVNFITSIATGILTVSLLDQAPENVSQTVNRIVDHTIETIATSTPIAAIVNPTPTVVTKTIIENTDDLLTAAISDQAERSVQIYSNEGTSTPVVALGTYLPKARAIVTATQNELPADIIVVFADGSSQMASISHSGATLTIYGFADSSILPAAPAATLATEDSLKQGQAVVALTSDGSAVTGIVSKVDDTTGIHTSLPLIPAGYAAVDAAGDIIGISSGVAGIYFPADKISTLLTATTTASGP
jgi:hypothetical protein